MTLKTKRLVKSDFDEFIELYCADDRSKREATWSAETEEGRWRNFSYEEIIARDKTNLDIFWLKDESLADLDNLPDPDTIAEEIVENLEAGLESFKGIVNNLNE